jgi:hypothetical protein
MSPTPTLQTDTYDESFIDSMFSSTRLFAPIMAAIVTWVIGIYVALVLESPYRNDDLLNKEIPSILKTTHQSLGGFIWLQVSGYVRADARFFPGGLGWTYALFDVFDERSSYKLVVGLLLALGLSITGLCVAAMARSWVPAGAFVLIASGTLQVRLWADGLTSFAGLMMLTTALTLGALLLLLVKSGRWWTALAGVLYLAALLTYEAVFVLAPFLIAVIVLSRRDWRPTIAIAVPAILALLTAISLRLITHAHPISEYTLSFGPSAVLSTFAKQMVAALPLTQWWIGHTDGLPPIAGTLILLSVVLVGLPVFLGLYHLARNLRLPNEHAAKLCGLLGAGLWIAPAALIAVTKRWQVSMPWGQGYISVVYEYLGFALCLLSLWLFVGRRLQIGYRERAIRVWNIGGAAALAVMATMTLAANLSLMP